MKEEERQPGEGWQHWWLRTGGFHGWFGWIEALTLTAVFATATRKVDQLPLKLLLGAITAISAWYAFNWGIAGISKFMGDRLARARIPNWAKDPLALILGIGVSLAVVLGLIPVFLDLLE